MAKAADRIADRQIASATQKYLEKSPIRHSRNPISGAIALLLRAPIAKADLVALFDSRATYAAIQSWRYGQCEAPQWAIDILDRKIELATAPHQEARKRLRAGPGKGWNKGAAIGIGQWRIKRAEQKEKAGG